MKASLPPPPPSISPLYKKIAKAIIQNLRRLSQSNRQLYDRALATYDQNPYESIQMIRQTPTGKEHFDQHMLQFNSWNESFPKALEKIGKKQELKNYDICQKLIAMQSKIKLTNMHNSYLTYIVILMNKEKIPGLNPQFVNMWMDIKIQLRKAKQQALKISEEQKQKKPGEQKQMTKPVTQPTTNSKNEAQKQKQRERQRQREKQRKLQQLRKQQQKQKQEQQKRQEQLKKAQKLEQQKRQQQQRRQQKQRERQRQRQRQREKQRQEQQRKNEQNRRKTEDQKRQAQKLEKQKQQQRILYQQKRQQEQMQRQEQRRQAQQQKKLQEKQTKSKQNENRWRRAKQARLSTMIKYLESRKQFSYGSNQTGVAKEILHNLERFMKDKMQKILRYSKIRTPGLANQDMGDEFRLYSSKSNIFTPKHSIMLPQTEVRILKLKYPSKSQRYVRLRIEEEKLQQKLKAELKQKTEADKKLQKIIQSYIITDQNVQHEFERDEGPPKRKRLTVLSQVIQYVIELDPWFQDLYIMEKTFYRGYTPS